MRFEDAYRMLVKPNDGPISRALNRRISVRISIFITEHGAPISPTDMTVLSFITAITGAVFFVLNWPLIGGLLAQLASILDGCDGEIARLTGQTSKSGGIIDAILDRVADAALISALGILALREPWPYWPEWVHLPQWPLLALTLTALAISGSLVVSYCSAISRAIASRELKRVVATRDVRLFTIMLSGLVCQWLPWAASAVLAVLVLMTWADVANCLAQAAALREEVE